MVLLTAVVIVTYRDEHRLGALLALAGAYGFAGVSTALWTLNRMRAKSSPFISNLEELRKDGQRLGGDE